ncbi:Flagellar sensor histidine kinase FleS [hydrothermal vent metagenome]|uniref:histidine kinase n=1 Tax=hydrothermal vent metagenome TaxID=652676 RepID=A0A3B0X6N0_9ZZZZ
MQQLASRQDQITDEIQKTDINQQLADPVQLVAAFEQFGRLSDQLQQSYSELDKRASELTEQLAFAQGERLKQLAEKEQLAHHLETLLNALPAGVLLVDDEGVIQTANPAAERLLEYELGGKRWREVYTRSVAKRSDQDLHLNSGRILSFKSQSLKEQNLDNQQGEIILLDDITEQRLFEGLASRESRLAAMGQMAAGLAHQLRTPLASAILYASQLSQISSNSVDKNQRIQEKAVDKVATCLRYLEKLINDMLMYAKGGEFSEHQFLLDELLVTFNTRIKHQLKQSKAQLVISSQLKDIKLTGSVDVLVSVLINLAENAIQVCDKKICKLRLEGYRQVDYLILAMHDNGPGLSVDQQSKIFQPFFTRREGGTGLGLAVAQSIVQAHHGDLLVRSQPGSGSVFYVCLPLNRNEQFLASGPESRASLHTLNEGLPDKCINGEDYDARQ